MPRYLTLESGCGDVNNPAYDIKVDIRSLPHVNYVTDMANLSEIPDHAISLIKSSASLEHIPPDHQARTVAEWHRVLVRGGIVLIQTPDLDWINEQLSSENQKEREWAIVLLSGGQRHEHDVHKGLFTAERLRELFTSNGFKVLSLRDGNEAAGSLDGIFEAI